MSKDETRRLLRIREDLERRIGRLQIEIEDLRRAVAAIDRVIVRSGFRQPIQEEEEEDAFSIKAKDGAVLGSMQVDEKEIIFTPREDLNFMTSIPPFQSFLIDRVFENMRFSDESRAARGEIPPEDVLSYEVSADGERLLRVVVHNFGGERRLREIRSSIRWIFDKMYEKLQQT